MPSKRKGAMQPKADGQLTRKPRGRPRRRSTSKPEATWKDRLVLNPGDVLRQAQSISTGTLGQRDVEQYDVVDAQGQIVGAVTYTANTSLKPPFITRYWLVQVDIARKVIVDSRW